jgi:hypothetical protein
MSQAPTRTPCQVCLRHKSIVNVPAVALAVSTPMSRRSKDLAPAAIVLSFLALKWLLVDCLLIYRYIDIVVTCWTTTCVLELAYYSDAAGTFELYQARTCKLHMLVWCVWFELSEHCTLLGYYSIIVVVVGPASIKPSQKQMITYSVWLMHCAFANMRLYVCLRHAACTLPSDTNLN